MSSSALRLRTIMNNPSTLDMSREWMALDKHTPPTLLIYGESLANAILRTESIATYDLVAYWKIVTQISPPGIPAVESHFQASPFLLRGEAHRHARKELTQPYRRVEAALDQWLPAYTETFFGAFQRGQSIRPKLLALDFIDGVFRQMLAREIGCEAEEIPPLPSGLFNLLPRLSSVQEFDRRLEAVAEIIEKFSGDSGKHRDEAWTLASIVVMGQQPLLGAIVYGLINEPPFGGRWDSETLMRQSSPVSVFGREVSEDVTVNGLSLVKGQLVHVCPSLAHLHADFHSRDNVSRKSIAFGAGPHICSGRKISLKITDAFFNQWACTDHIKIDTSGVSLVRDMVLTPQEKT